MNHSATDNAKPSSGDNKKKSSGPQLYTQILIGLILGSVLAVLAKWLFVAPEAIIGSGIPSEDFLRFGERWIQPIGDLFIRSIILTVVPLVFTSISVGVYSLGDLRTLGRMGSRTFAIFLSTAFLGACLATLLYVIFEPGNSIPAETRELLSEQFKGLSNAAGQKSGQAAEHFGGSLFQILLSLIPANLFSALGSNRELIKVILFALLLGASLTMIPKEKAEPVANLLEGINEAMITIISLLMKLAPYGVFALVFMVVARFGAQVLWALAMYTLVVVLALSAHLLLILAPLLRTLGGWSPLKFFAAIREIWITAFSTSSSSATLPTTMRVLEEKADVPRSVSSFVLPLGATINMDGTTIYQVIAVHFVCQVFGVALPIESMLALILIAMLMAIGAAGVPGGVIPLLYVVMASVGVPESALAPGIALILGMDRILDMCRSAVNVIGDSVTAVIIASQEQRRKESIERS